VGAVKSRFTIHCYAVFEDSRLRAGQVAHRFWQQLPEALDVIAPRASALPEATPAVASTPSRNRIARCPAIVGSFSAMPSTSRSYWACAEAVSG
jgi:hypothetical protein